ncbi:N-terminal acetyltransferase B complex auxiliary subunit NAA25 isoform X3 [Tanacetum coccineum]
MEKRDLSNNWDVLIDQYARSVCNNSIGSILRSIVLSTAVYNIWKERNTRLFTGKVKDDKTVKVSFLIAMVLQIGLGKGLCFHYGSFRLVQDDTSWSILCIVKEVMLDLNKGTPSCNALAFYTYSISRQPSDLPLGHSDLLQQWDFYNPWPYDQLSYSFCTSQSMAQCGVAYTCCSWVSIHSVVTSPLSLVVSIPCYCGSLSSGGSPDCINSSSTSSKNVFGQHITFFKIRELIGDTFSLSDGDLVGFAVQMTDMYCQNLYLSKDLDVQESMYGEDFLSMKCNVLVQLFWRIKHAGYLLEAIMV